MHVIKTILIAAVLGATLACTTAPVATTSPSGTAAWYDHQCRERGAVCPQSPPKFTQPVPGCAVALPSN